METYPDLGVGLTSQGTCMPPGLDGRVTTGREARRPLGWKAVPVNQADWEQRLADAWASIDQLSLRFNPVGCGGAV
jgi:hypothetical protein